jgi:hypothetical protein
MLNSAEGFTMQAISPFDALINTTIGPFPPGTNVYASISLSMLDTLYSKSPDLYSPDPTFAATAFIDSWTVYLPNGRQSRPQSGGVYPDFTQNSAVINNCATVTFALFVKRVWAIAQINAFTFS